MDATRYPNPRSSLDVERICPLLDLVADVMKDQYRPQLLRITAYEDEKKLGSTLVTNQGAQWAILGYVFATHLTVEHLGDA
ncbi:MAG TPA: hypothetical protein VGJ07_23820 [Rugosimonospora sp.]|jgi:hypothetical protein